MNRRDSLTSQLASAVLERPVGDEDRRAAARHVLDWLACALAALTTETGERLLAYGKQHLATEPSRSTPTLPAIGVGWLPRERALLINASLGNVLEMDDIHRTSVLHPGPVIMPVALTVAAEANASGPACLDAIVRGYEAMIRVGETFGRQHYRYWHPTATAGPYGAATASAALLGLEAEQLANAMGHAGSVAGGLWQTRLEPSMTKSWHNARAAHHGILAAELAAVGFIGPKQILEGDLGVFAAMCPDAMPDTLAANRDRPWAIHETSLKPWPACRHAHSTLEAALVLRERLANRELDAVHVHTYADAARFCDNPEPATELEAKFSLQHVIAICVLRGEPGLTDFNEQARRDLNVASLRRRVDVTVSDALSQAFPAHYGAHLSAHCADGEIIDIEMPDALGDPPRVLDDQRLLRKANELMSAAGCDDQRVAQLIEACLGLATHETPLGLAESLAQVNGLRPDSGETRERT